MDSKDSSEQMSWERCVKWHTHYSEKKKEYIEKINSSTNPDIANIYKRLHEYAQKQINGYEDKFPQLKTGQNPKQKVIYETYTTLKANNIVEYGYTFKIENSDYTIEDMILGEIDMSLINADVKIQQDWNSNARKALLRSDELTKSYC